MDTFVFRAVLTLFVLSAVLLTVNAFCPAGKAGTLCDKYNYAFQKHANQREEWISHSAHFAVDDNTTTCTVMTPPVSDPWWTVDLSKDMFIVGADFYIASESIAKMRSYTIEVQKSGESQWNMCHAATGTAGSFISPLHITCNTRLQGRVLRFTAYHQELNLQLCDVGVYGSCVDGSYGNYCEKTCGNCREDRPVCDKTTGRCPTGCDTGYDGNTCDEICPHGRYGNLCSGTCGKCQYNVTCNRFDGECPNGGVCEIGYKSPMCQNQCDDGTYGSGCVDCGHCKYDRPCNKLNGTCMDGCNPGFRGVKCDMNCTDGMYGDACIYECGNCYTDSTEPGPCNYITGQCDLGCAPGYIQDANFLDSTRQCRSECPNYKWGLNCVNSCGHCGRLNESEVITVPCVKSDGSCFTGCLDGWQGLSCTEPCDPGTFGRNCKETCGHCKDNAPCDRQTAECPGECADGYLGNKCTQQCAVGFYGYKCQRQCPNNCETNCTITDGSCICKLGWTGPLCQEECPSNHYGRNCEFVCGNCKPGTTCHQGDGTCLDGCASEWTGLKCDAKKIIEKYERSYGDIIGGAIGGVIALALIIAFAIWVGWRYKQDKSIHIRELASSLRRMSIRGRQSLRRSIQRLSTRGRKTDQRQLGKDADKPAVTNGTRSKQQSHRMYDCVKLQSNLIHYDDFPRLYLQLQEATPDGRTLLHDSFNSFIAQRPRDHSGPTNGSAYYNAAVEPEDIEVQMDSSSSSSRIPEFLPLGANLSGFLLVNAPAASEVLWRHLQQRQIETVISIGKEASFSWRPGERITIGQDIVECIDVQLHGSHKETKLTVQHIGTRVRRAVRHLECFFWSSEEKLPLIPTLLMFIERFQQLHYAQRERTILVNYLNLHQPAILFTLVASTLEILIDSKRTDVLRTVAIGGKPTAKSVRTFEEFKYLHDVIFQYIVSKENRSRSTAI